MLKILIATGNKHKASELVEILPAQTSGGQRIEYLTLADFPSIPEPVEDGATLQENALIKARAGMSGSGLVTLADDTGLMVDFLNGAPGVYSGRYAYPDRTDYAANNTKLLKELSGLPLEKRSARFMTVAALVKPGGETVFKEGKVEGFIALSASGGNGFGYDPLFIVKSLNKSMADITTEEKNKISHRALAFAQMADIIKNLP